jgi:hypothetical protein
MKRWTGTNQMGLLELFCSSVVISSIFSKLHVIHLPVTRVLTPGITSSSATASATWRTEHVFLYCPSLGLLRWIYATRCASDKVLRKEDKLNKQRAKLLLEDRSPSLNVCIFKSLSLVVGRDSVVGIASRYGQMVWGSNPAEGEIFRNRPYWPWEQPILL